MKRRTFLKALGAALAAPVVTLKAIAKPVDPAEAWEPGPGFGLVSPRPEGAILAIAGEPLHTGDMVYLEGRYAYTVGSSTYGTKRIAGYSAGTVTESADVAIIPMASGDRSVPVW